MRKKIALIIPTLTSGGAERVMSTLANNFSKDSELEVHLILYLRNEIFYKISDEVIIHRVDFDYKKFSTVKSTLKIFRYLKKTLKEMKPDSLLSFGGKYNSLVILSSLGLSINCYVSDRSRPGISYGKIQDLINPLIYRFSRGIIAQTSKAKEFIFKKTKHSNIVVIPNPIPILNKLEPKEKIILNIGRFIASKQQIKLIEVFANIQAEDWQLVFLGEGDDLEKCKQRTKELNLEKQVKFLGVQKDIITYLSKSMIFAFTSISEGFPNSLAEAMSAGCACISFDCIAGPSDIIDHNQNGFLIPLNDWDGYTESLSELMINEKLRHEFNSRASKRALAFSENIIVDKYKKVLFA